MLFPTSFIQSGHTWNFQIDQTLNTAITDTEQPHKSLPEVREQPDKLPHCQFNFGIMTSTARAL